MTVTATPTEAAVAVGEAAAPLLPADDGWTVVAEGASLPGGTTAAVGARIDDHLIALVVTADMSRRIQVGPPPAEGLLDGLAPAAQAIAEVLGLTGDFELEQMTAATVQGAITPDSAVAALLDGEEHLVSVAVCPPAAGHDDAESETATFEPIVGGANTGGSVSGLEMLHEVVMGVTVELGRTRMSLRDILSVVPGSVIELDRAASEPVDVLVNGTLIARGEVVVIDEEFGLRVTEIIGQDEQGVNGELNP